MTDDGDFELYSAGAIKRMIKNISDILMNHDKRLGKMEMRLFDIEVQLSKMWALHEEQYKYNACIKKDFFNLTDVDHKIESHLQRSCADFIVDLPIKRSDPMGIDHTVDLAIKEMIEND